MRRYHYAALVAAFCLGGCNQNLVFFNDTTTVVEVDFVQKDALRAPQLKKLGPNEAIASHACAGEVAAIFVRLDADKTMSLDPAGLCRSNRCGCEIKASQLKLR